MATYAGRYSEDLQDRFGNAFRNATVAVQTTGGAAVTLYADRDKTAYVPASGLAANEIKSDDKGNLVFFADPGNYRIVVTPVGGVALNPVEVSVYPDPLEPEAAANAYVPGGTDVAVADGGTGASSAAAARTNLGLGNVDNTSDANKPVSTAQQTALDEKVGAFEDPRQAVTIGEVVGDGDGLTVNIASPWGITAGGLPYYDPDGAAPGEDAVLSLEGGAFVLTRL